MKGYYNNPEANEKTFMEDGWMRTGDVCKSDSSKQESFVMDRLKELIKMNGFQAVLAELESLLLSISDMLDYCVIGVYNPEEATKYPRVYIVPSPHVAADEALVKKISSYAATNAAGYKRLRGGYK